MLLTRRNVFLLSLVALSVYVFSLVRLAPVISALRMYLNEEFIRGALLETLPGHRIWSPAPTEAGEASGAKTWQYEETRTTFTRHIVAVGDLHGDLSNARRVLRFSGVTDDMGDWSGDVDFFVQTGDIIDRFGSFLTAEGHLFVDLFFFFAEAMIPLNCLLGWINCVSRPLLRAGQF
jgi:hypothetical protein